MKTVYYKKVGRRYEAVSEYDSDLYSSFSQGAHLVVSMPGSQSTKHNVDPAFVPMIAAGMFATDAISRVIMTATNARPERSLITVEQRDAWEKLSRALGDERCAMTYPSARDAAEAAVVELQAQAAALLSNPAVQLAYDQFILLCKLTSKQTKETK